MKSFSTKPKVERLEIEVDGQQVYVRQLTAGDKILLSESQSELAAAATEIRNKANTGNVEDLGQLAASTLSKSQYQAWVRYMGDYVFLRWCDENGKRRYDQRPKFNALPSEIIEAIYAESAKLDAEEAQEAAEKNS